ncbi:MAG: UDP-3-O-(3-hydroxymyristoyl)glucosamine N-acyltransferase [Succiniclasticum sp.]|jgi:UDP-3-O-[3-hydroxymyristoyl] glucosamine N-acyltransferase
MEKTLQELAAFLHGTLEHGSDLKITGVNGLVEAGPTEISFAVHPYVEVCGKSHAGAMILAHGEGDLQDRPVIRVENPREAFAELLELFRPQEEVERVISPLAYIAEDAKVGKNVAVMPFAVIDSGAEVGDNTVVYPYTYVGRHVKVGTDCILYPHVTIRENCVVGNRDILQSGCVIGGDGFGFVTTNGKHNKVLQTGNVILGDDVEVGCNSCIDRATVDSTIVGNGTKLDNLVHLGHNDVVGENNLFVALVGIPGSVHIGNNNTFGGQAATVGHITIGSNNTFAGRCGVIGNVGDGQVLAGFPSMPHMEWLRQQSRLRKITEISKTVRELKKQVAALQEQLDAARSGEGQ